jgi:type III restriction enzyme
LGRKNRLQKIVFEVSRDVFDQVKPTWRGSPEALIGQVIGLVEKVLRSDRIAIDPPLFNQDELRRRILLTLNMNRIVQHLWNAIRFEEENTTRLTPVFDRLRPILSTSDMQPWYTGKPCAPTTKSHINQCVFDSSWEACEAYHLDNNPRVQAWVKNDHLGFDVLYAHRGAIRKYRPDFLVRLTSGAMLVLEVKGEDSEENQAKREFLAEWVRAVNTQGEFGVWACDTSYSTDDLAQILAKHGEKRS